MAGIFRYAVVLFVCISFSNSVFAGKSTKGKKGKGGSNPIIEVEADFDRISYVDGDTIRYAFQAEDGVFGPDGRPYKGSLRLLGYDTPEKMAVGIGMFYHQSCGPRASAEIKSILSSAHAITILARPDRRTKGRILAHVVIKDSAGKSETLAAKMIRRGMAYETVSVFGNNGFPQFRPEIDKAWQDSPIFADIEEGRVPAFMSPYIWRQMNLHFSHRNTRWRYMSQQEQDEWMRAEYPTEHREALQRADEKRSEMLESARTNPNTRRSREALFFLNKMPRNQDERNCVIN